MTALAAVLLLLEPIHYTLRFPAPETHYVEVEATVPTEGRPSVELFMAVWTPGSYLVREYERHVEGVTATADGRPQPVVKTRKNRWKIDTGGAATITVRYRVYGREMTVRNNWIDAGMAIINGAPTFLTLAGSAPLVGSADGIGADARFYRPTGLATDIIGNVYVTDQDRKSTRLNSSHVSESRMPSSA